MRARWVPKLNDPGCKRGFRVCRLEIDCHPGPARLLVALSEGLVRPGPGGVHWKTRTNYALQGVVPTGEDEMSIYVTRAAGTPSWHVGRYVLRVDGFASVNAPYSGGEMVTRLFTFSGRELVLNYSTSAAGSIRVEVQSPSGKVIPDYRWKTRPRSSETRSSGWWRGRRERMSRPWRASRFVCASP